MPSRKASDLCVTLQVFWPKLRSWYEDKFPGRKLILTCTHRSVAEQKELYDSAKKTGKILTQIDGVNKKSKHNYLPAHAFDVAVVIDGKAQWQEVYYIPLGRTIGELGYSDRIRWGGHFSFRDYPHFEMYWQGHPDFYGMTKI